MVTGTHRVLETIGSTRWLPLENDDEPVCLANYTVI